MYLIVLNTLNKTTGWAETKPGPSRVSNAIIRRTKMIKKIEENKRKWWEIGEMFLSCRLGYVPKPAYFSAVIYNSVGLIQFICIHSDLNLTWWYILCIQNGKSILCIKLCGYTYDDGQATINSYLRMIVYTMHSYYIMTSIPFQVIGENADCVFWDFEISDWSQDGCQLVTGLTNNRTTCHCDHLTNFAVLVVNTNCIK